MFRKSGLACKSSFSVTVAQLNCVYVHEVLWLLSSVTFLCGSDWMQHIPCKDFHTLSLVVNLQIVDSGKVSVHLSCHFTCTALLSMKCCITPHVGVLGHLNCKRCSLCTARVYCSTVLKMACCCMHCVDCREWVGHLLHLILSYFRVE